MIGHKSTYLIFLLIATARTRHIFSKYEESTCMKTTNKLVLSNIEFNRNESPGKTRFKQLTGVDLDGTDIPNAERNIFSSCPTSSASIDPCICTGNSSYTALDCSAVDNFNTLKTILNTAEFHSTSITIFVFAPNRLVGTTLYSGTFGSLSFEEIYIESTSLITVENAAFAGSESTLLVLSLHANDLVANFPFEELQTFTILREFRIERGSIASIPTIGAQSTLQRFSVLSNSVTTIDAHAFTDLASLSKLELAENDLQSITGDTFHFSSSNTMVYLENNGLSTLGEFTGSPPMLLQAKGNQMTSFSQTVYEPILKRIVECSYDDISIVDVSDNPIECSELDWVYQNEGYTHLVLSDCPKP